MKVELAMEHVDRKSLAFDLKVLCMTVWMMTIGKWLPIKEHPAVSALRNKIKEGSRIH